MAARLHAKKALARVRFRAAAEEPEQAAPDQAAGAAPLPDDELLFTVGITKYPQGRAAFQVLQVRCRPLRLVLKSQHDSSSCEVAYPAAAPSKGAQSTQPSSPHSTCSAPLRISDQPSP